MRKLRIALAVAASVAFCLGAPYFVLRTFAPRNTSDALRESDARRRSSIRTAAEQARIQYRAVADWASADPKFTADARAALIRSDLRPIFFVGRVRDYDTANRSLVLTIDVETDQAAPEFVFRLTCQREMVEQHAKDGFTGVFAGVAAFKDVRMTKDSDSPIVTGLGRRFTAFGECVHFSNLDW